jgi:phosphoribosylanthranilate isomerase
MVRIKICGITREEDAIAAAHLGAHALGFVFYEKSPRRIQPAAARNIIRRLPPFVTAVGLFVNADESFVRSVLAEVPLQLLQFHGDETATECERFGMPYLRAVRMRRETNLLQYAQQFAAAQGLLLDAHVEGIPGGTGQRFDWQWIPGNLSVPIVLSGGLNPDNVAEAVRQVKPWAVDVSSGVELSKGLKDHAKMKAFFDGVRHASV